MPRLYILATIFLPIVLSSCAHFPTPDLSAPVLVDSDNDGVPDNYDYRDDFTKSLYYDKCPTSTPKGAKVDDWGCPPDANKDGVPVVLSSYARTLPPTLSTLVLSPPVPVDSDKDGVPDNYDYRNEFTKPPYYDKCPATPSGVKVDDWGCPPDADRDAVPDYLDKCSDTPLGVKVDQDGCPPDDDKDGVPNYLDKCPGTPAGVNVDKVGCPPDADKDGVPDYRDKCPDTPLGVKVDQDGCYTTARIVLLPEADGKVGKIEVSTAGGSQKLDKAWESTELVSPEQTPSIPKVVDEKEVRETFKDALAAQPAPPAVFIIYFKPGTTQLTKQSSRLITEVLEAIKSQKSTHIRVVGHTDTVASLEYNRRLSRRRAQSVADLLAAKDVDSASIKIEFYGKEKPLIKTPDGVDEPKNRRVEIIVK